MRTTTARELRERIAHCKGLQRMVIDNVPSVRLRKSSQRPRSTFGSLRRTTGLSAFLRTQRSKWCACLVELV
jgi:hypothetical protein